MPSSCASLHLVRSHKTARWRAHSGDLPEWAATKEIGVNTGYAFCTRSKSPSRRGPAVGPAPQRARRRGPVVLSGPLEQVGDHAGDPPRFSQRPDVRAHRACCRYDPRKRQGGRPRRCASENGDPRAKGSRGLAIRAGAYLERVIQGSLSRLSRLLRILGYHCHDLNLVSSQTAYVKWGKGSRTPLSLHEDRRQAARGGLRAALRVARQGPVSSAAPEGIAPPGNS